MLLPTGPAPGDPSVTFTVAICTWNRASLLLETLESVAGIDRPDSAWELIVVNNHSTDETEKVLDRMASRLPLRRIFEPEPGISNARNAAVRYARGDYIVWTDDDATVDKNWLCAYERAVKRRPDAAFFGGPVRPRFEGTPPPWLSEIWEDVAGAFAMRDLGAEPLELTTERLPYGANFVTRALEQRRFLYDPHLGRRQASGSLGEEVAVMEAILACGGTGWWVPDASVEHWISKERQTVRYLRGYYALLGRTWHRQNRHGAGARWGNRCSLWPKALYAELKYACARLTGNPNRWVKPLARASTLWGAIKDGPPG
jgi:glycosyltransferase involved in cell wall biosynthesis